MMSLRAKYNLSTHGINSFEKEDGFVDYKLFNIQDDPEGLIMDVHRIFVDEDKRGGGYGGKLVDEAIELVETEINKDKEEKKKIKKLLGHIHGQDGMKESSLQAQFKYGFKIAKIEADHVILIKEL